VSDSTGKKVTVSVRVYEDTYDAIKDEQNRERKRTRIEPTIADLMERAWQRYLGTEITVRENLAVKQKPTFHVGEISCSITDEIPKAILGFVERNNPAELKTATMLLESLLRELQEIIATTETAANAKTDTGLPRTEALTAATDRITEEGQKLFQKTAETHGGSNNAPTSPERKRKDHPRRSA
jgi:hypothetical protein